MSDSKKQYELSIKPLAHPKAIVQGPKYRFTVLTDRMIRMEYQEDGIFTDAATKTVLCREFDVPAFRVEESEDKLEIITDALHLYYDKKPFSAAGLFIGLKEGFSVGDSVWNYGDEIHDLRGTARTLDNADGEIPLEAGLMSVDGYTLLDDSESAILSEDGWIRAKAQKGLDLYFFGYGHDYLKCLQDFYHLSGATPLLPKYTLGNWWSRFYPYSEATYLHLMEQFEQKNIPISVSVIDMDWHKTNVPGKYGSGWTGYTWNDTLFPNPKRFMDRLHKMGKRVTLNLHPADGVRAFEDAYLPMAKALGVDYQHEEKIPFDVTNRSYMEAYFKYLHHPHEEAGVDFWWVDWQQGNVSRTPGVDPLWMLNHLHFMDSGREGKLPLTFSRYAGLGSHRYPVGFSGDTITTWESLRFQPYFTANATNAGYTWWSHDIGGHQKGKRDDELVTRWIQFGVFSPIMRLHSTANEFYGKEPWNYNPIAEQVMTSFLQLRHKLVPYLHTMNYRTHEEGIPLICPMYYRHDEREAYGVPNEYYFGEMIACPITSPADRETGLAEVDVWLPEGTYIDFFTGQIYKGEGRRLLYRGLDTMPVLAPAGTIVPMAVDFIHSCTQNPEELDVLVFHGADGTFSFYEDDCSETLGMQPAITQFGYHVEEKVVSFDMQVLQDAECVIPEERSYNIRVRGIQRFDKESVSCQGEQGEIDCEVAYDEALSELVIKVKGKRLKRFTIELTGRSRIVQSDRRAVIVKMLQSAQISYDTKEKIARILEGESDNSRIFAALHELKLTDTLFGAILEQLTSDC